MFAGILDKKLEDVRGIISSMKDFSPDSINNSRLDDFTKGFVLHETAMISDASEMLTIAEKSIRLEVNYALRPKWTLINFLFGTVESKPAAEIIRKLDIFPYYLYYAEAIRALCEEDSQVSIRSFQAKNLIDEANIIIYRKLTTGMTSLKVKNFFLQVFRLKYGSRREISLDMYIPFMFIRIFLEDKGYGELLNKFGIIEGLKDETDIELKTIIKIFTGKYTPSDARQEVTEKEKNETSPSGGAEIPEDKEHTGESAPKEAEDTGGTADTAYEELKKSKKTIKENLEYRGIRQLFREDELQEIAKKIFKSNKYGMYDAFYELEKKKDWREATDYLKKKFSDNRVNIRDRTVIVFVDTLNNYFEKRLD